MILMLDLFEGHNNSYYIVKASNLSWQCIKERAKDIFMNIFSATKEQELVRAGKLPQSQEQALATSGWKWRYDWIMLGTANGWHGIPSRLSLRSEPFAMVAGCSSLSAPQPSARDLQNQDVEVLQKTKLLVGCVRRMVDR